MIYDRFYFSILSDKEKIVYRKIYDGITAFEKTVTLTQKECHGVLLTKMCQYISLDNPHLYYADFNNVELWQSLLSVEVHISYLYTVQDAQILQEKANIVLGKMLKRVSGSSDYEKELSVHDLLIENVLYDSEALQNLSAHLPRSNTMLGVLFYKSAVCEGIAKTVKMLLNLLGIKCIVVIGKSKKDGEPHAWNIVKIADKPYHLDVTWNLQDSEKGVLRHDYFNLTDNEMGKDHEWNIAYPECDALDFNYFEKNGLIAHTEQEFESLLCSALRKGISVLGVKCSYKVTSDEILKVASTVNEKCKCLYLSVKVLINEEQNVFSVIYG